MHTRNNRLAGMLGLLGVLGSLCAPLARAQDTQDLQILSADVPPLSFTVDGRPTGFCIEIVEEIQRRTGNRAAIREMPWVRAYSMAQGQAAMMLVCPKRTPEREPLFKWVGPLRLSSYNLYALKNSRLHVDTLQAASRVDGIVVPRESFMYQKLKDEGFTNLEPVNTSMVALKMLLAGRGALMALDHEQLPTLLQQAHVRPEDIELVFKAMPTSSYLMASKPTTDALVASWQAALDAMKADGSFEKLHRKWFPDELVAPALLKRKAAAAALPPAVHGKGEHRDVAQSSE